MGGADLPRSLKESLDNTKVSYAPVGNTGLRVSIPILGTMSFGHKDWQPWVIDDPVEVDAILKGAYDMGLNTWDTANVYSNGLSEKLIGDTLKKHKIPRHKVVLLSKCFSPVGEEPNVHVISYPKQISASKDYVNQEGLSRTAIFNAVNGSLERLGTDYLDLLQIHRFDKTVPVEETMKALHDLVQNGTVRYIGASSMWAYQFAQMQLVAERHGWTKFISMQNHYSLCYREEEREMNKYCHETGVGLVPWAPLYRGLLARPLGSGKTKRQESVAGNPMFAGLHGGDEEIIKRVSEVAEKRSWKMTHVALVWIVQKRTTPIVGASSLARLQEVCEVGGKSLTEDEMKYLEEPYLPRTIVGHR